MPFAAAAGCVPGPRAVPVCRWGWCGEGHVAGPMGASASLEQGRGSPTLPLSLPGSLPQRVPPGPGWQILPPVYHVREERDIQFKSPRCGWRPLAKVGRVHHGAQPCVVGLGKERTQPRQSREPGWRRRCQSRGKPFLWVSPPQLAPRTERGQSAASRLLLCSPGPARSDAPPPETPARRSFQYNLYWGD